MDSINQFFVNPIKYQFFDFEGRSTVQQYWMFTMWSFIFSFILNLIDLSIVGSIMSLVLLFPSLGLGARRLHDIGKSGWWQLLWFIPIIGWIILIVFLVTKGDSGQNAYGPDPIGVTPSIPVPIPPTIPSPGPTAPVESSTINDELVDTNPK